MGKMSELDMDRRQVERLTNVVPPPSFAQTARAGEAAPIERQAGRCDPDRIGFPQKLRSDGGCARIADRDRQEPTASCPRSLRASSSARQIGGRIVTDFILFLGIAFAGTLFIVGVCLHV
jgi:hypothetical protein